jgi:hypothetical protein
LTGQMQAANGMSTACVIRNWSEAGVCVEFPRGLAIPDRITLTWKRHDHPRNARVVWRTRNTAGLQFT